MRYQLRPYQQTGVNQIRVAYSSGFHAPLYTLPTGGGKTILYAFITESAAAKGNRVLILEHRQELITQASDKLSEIGVSHGIIAPGHSMTGDPVQVASVQTLVKRLDRMPEQDLIIIDEAHHSTAGSWSKILKHFSTAKILGVTATPARLDGKGLGQHCGGFFDTLIEGPSVRWLIDNGFLCQPVVYAPPTDFNTEGIRTIAGDFDKKEVNHRIDKPKITGCAIEHYQRLCPGVPALVFCASIKHAEHVLQQAREAGIASEIIDGTLSRQVRKHRIDALASGALQWLVTVDVVSEGTDIPVVGAAILLRPTKSLGLYLQQVGRALRIYPGKTEAIILDHVGNCWRHGMPDDVRHWTLDGYRQKRRGKNAPGPDVKISMCKYCYAVFSAGAVKCPLCGIPVQVNGREYKQVDGQLQKVPGTDKKEKQRKYTPTEYDRLRKCIAVAKAMGMSKQTAFRVFHRTKRGAA